MSEVIQMKEITEREIKERFENSDTVYSYLRRWISLRCPTTIEEVMDIFREWSYGMKDTKGHLIDEYFEGDENLLRSYLKERLIEHKRVDVSRETHGCYSDTWIVPSSVITDLEESDEDFEETFDELGLDIYDGSYETDEVHPIEYEMWSHLNLPELS